MPIALPSSQAADHPGVEQIYRDHHGWLQSLLQRKLGDVQHAADLAQDAFMALLRTRPGTVAAEGLREPRAYLRTVAHGLLVDHFRRQTLERAYLEALAHQPEPLARSPEEHHMVLQALQRIDRMLDALGPRAREVFLLSQLEHLTYGEIAQRMGISVRTVKRDMQSGFAHCIAAML
ncbi:MULTISPECIES: sigma-70 family RNA polymerase sigma factor [Comamonadaceae]|uniref:sigma-70 family RNA polymerase sigma factor n=1 Tax=Acidovorax sacchari TaxID=3230736 RepID=UPI0034A202D0